MNWKKLSHGSNLTRINLSAIAIQLSKCLNLRDQTDQRICI